MGLHLGRSKFLCKEKGNCYGLWYPPTKTCELQALHLLKVGRRHL